MNKQQLLDEAKALVAKSSLGEALDVVKNFLKNDRKYKTLHKEALSLLAFYNKTKREEENDLISFDNAKVNYNQTTDRLLNLLGYIEADDFSPAALKPPTTPLQAYYQSHKWQVLTAIPTLLIAIVLLVWALKKDNGAAIEEEGPVTIEDCPFMDNTDFKIMLLRFFLPAGGELSPEGLIAEQLETFCIDNGIRAEIEIMQKPKKPDRVINYDDANNLGILCNAKMVVWGRAEKSEATTEISTRYRYLGDGGDISFSQIKWQGQDQVGAEKTLSSLVTQGELLDDIENVILLVQGIIASDANDPQLALDNLEKLKTDDPKSVLLKGMVEAENHLKQGDNQKAISAYDDVLDSHPDYWLARNNRGMLEMQEGENLKAIEDLTAALDKKPDNPDMLFALGHAYENSDQLYMAKSVYQKVVLLKTDKEEEASQSLRDTEMKIKKHERAIEQIERKNLTRRTQHDTMTLLDARRNLGQTEKTAVLLNNTRLFRPTDPAVVATRIENLLREHNKTEAKKVLDTALQQGVKQEDIANNCKEKTVKNFVLKGN